MTRALLMDSDCEILNRPNEVSFNAVLLKELRIIALLRQLAEPGNTEGRVGPACASTPLGTH